MRHILKYIRKNKLLFLIILIGFFFQMIIIVPSGTDWCFGSACGIQFWGAHQHDMIWHLALAAVAFNHWPFTSPVYAGGGLSGYNYFLDLIVYFVTKLRLSPLVIYFKLLPIVWFILFTFTVIKLFRKLKKPTLTLIIFLIFAYFGGSFGFFFKLWHQKTIWGGSSMLAMQSLLSLTNLQYVYSLVSLLWLLIIGVDKQLDWRRGLIIAGLLTVTFGLKFYSGIIGTVIVGLLFLFNWQGWKQTLINSGLVIIGIILAIFLFYNPLTSVKTGIPLLISPFALVHSIIEEPTLFYLPKIANMRYILYQSGWGPRVLMIEVFSLLIFIIFNFGGRFFGLIDFGYRLIRKELSKFDWLIFFTVVAAIVLTGLLVQKGIWWNTIQFLYYGLFFANFLVADYLTRLIKTRRLIPIIFAIVLIAVNIPENLDVLRGFNPLQPSSYIPRQEVKALKFLRNQPEGVVYTPFFSAEIQKQIRSRYREPYPLYAVVDSAYIQALSGKQAYFNDQHILSITGVDYHKREQLIKSGSCQVLNQVRYIYEIKNYPDPVIVSCRVTLEKRFKKIFFNDLITIYSF